MSALDAPLRIGLYAPGYPGLGREGGIATYCGHLARGLASRGHEVHVLTPVAPGETSGDGLVTLHRARPEHVRLLDRAVPGAGPCLRIGGAMRHLVSRYALDVVEFPNWEGLGWLYAPARPAPLVVRLSTSSRESQEIDGNATDRRSRWDCRRERAMARAADGLVTHSGAHRERMAEELGVDGRSIEVIPPAVPTDPAYRRPGRRVDGDLRVVFLGRLEARKGTVDLLMAIPEVVRRVPGVTFTLIGNDRPHCPGGRTHAQFAEDELPAEARARIEFAGHLPDIEVQRRIQAADLFVAPSLYESFGLIFVEAMRWGVPVVGTRAGGIPEIVDDGRTGTLVAPGRPEELATAIVSLLRDEPRRVRLGEAGRREVEARFTVEAFASATEAFYRAVIAHRRGRPR